MTHTLLDPFSAVGLPESADPAAASAAAYANEVVELLSGLLLGLVRERLARMRRSAFLINTARGDVVDEAALVDALADGTIAGAGLDVYEHEPQVAPELLSMENVVLLPHLGSATHETRVAMGQRAVENLRRFFSGEPLRDPVG